MSNLASEAVGEVEKLRKEIDRLTAENDRLANAVADLQAELTQKDSDSFHRNRKEPEG